MIKKVLKITLLVVCLLAIAIGLFFHHFLFFEIDDLLGKGDYYSSLTSPYDHEMRLNIYYNSGNATGGSWTRVELETPEIRRNLYFQSNKLPSEYFECYWKDKTTVIIEGHPIDTKNGYYDYRDHLDER